MRQLTIGNKTFTNRFFLGTGKFASSEQARAALAASETELVTVAHIAEVGRMLKAIFSYLALEIAPQSEDGYRELFAAICSNGQEVIFKTWDNRI